MLRRSGFTRKAPEMRASSSSTTVKAKDYACAWCGGPFLKLLPLQAVCGPLCAGRKAKADRVAKVKQERQQTRARKAALKRIPDLIAEAQIEFNKFVRTRDAQKPCICCGKPLGDGDVGGAFDAGHYRSTGSASHLRFNEDNCHAQRKHCNRYGAGRAVDYRIGLISRIGLAAVEALEADNRIHKWTREELIAIRATYRAKLRELKGRT